MKQLSLPWNAYLYNTGIYSTVKAQSAFRKGWLAPSEGVCSWNHECTRYCQAIADTIRQVVPAKGCDPQTTFAKLVLVSRTHRIVGQSAFLRTALAARNLAKHSTQVLGEIPCLGYPLARMRRRGTRNGPCFRNDSVGRYRRAQGKEVVVRFVCPNKGLYVQILLHEMWKLWPDCEKGHPLLPHR